MTDDWAAEHARSSDPQTSKDAAASLQDHDITSLCFRLLRQYFILGDGLTDEEAAKRAAGYGKQPSPGAWKRCSDLRREGWIEPTGETRRASSGRQQQVCAITEVGKQQLKDFFNKGTR